MTEELSAFQKNIGIGFRDERLLQTAFIHRSYLNEHRGSKIEHNERLEFLGDAVLELVVTDHLFREFPKGNEGEMTSYRAALVNAVTLASVAEKIGMNDFLLLSKGEAKDTGRARHTILADAFEALVGAIYMDQGYEKANEFISTHVLPLLPDFIKDGAWIDAKSKFQEKAQDKTSITPAYKTMKETGPDHDKKFVVGVFLKDIEIASGTGKSKQEAEQEAAKAALQDPQWQ